MFLPAQGPGKQEFADSIHGALSLLFNFTPRFVFGSLLAYLISQTHDVWIRPLDTEQDWVQNR